MSVYFLKGDGIVKIGFSDDVASRIGALQSGLPFATEYLGYMPGGREVERHFHNQFAEHKHHGEWFYIIPELSNLISAVAIPSFPDAVEIGTFEKLRLQDEQFSDQAADWADEMMDELGQNDRNDWKVLGMLAKSLGMSAGRFRSIWMKEAGPLTVGEWFTIKAAALIAPTTRPEPEVGPDDK